MKQGVIDQLLSLWKDCLPICKERNIEKHILRECESSRRGLQCSWDCRLQGMHGSDQGIIHKQCGLAACLWWLGKQKCLQHSCNSLMHFLTNSIRLWIFISSWNGLYVQQLWKFLEGKASDSPTLSWMTCMGLGYWESQVCSKWVATWSPDFLKMLAILTRLVVVSVQVRVKNLTLPCDVNTGHGQMRSTATSSQGAQAIPQLGSKSWPGREG